MAYFPVWVPGTLAGVKHLLPDGIISLKFTWNLWLQSLFYIWA